MRVLLVMKPYLWYVWCHFCSLTSLYTPVAYYDKIFLYFVLHCWLWRSELKFVCAFSSLMFFSNPTAFGILIINIVYSNCCVSDELFSVVSTCLCLLFLFLFQKAFSKKKVNDRKDWLTRAMDDRKWRRQQGLSEVSYVRRNTVDDNHRQRANAKWAPVLYARFWSYLHGKGVL